MTSAICWTPDVPYPDAPPVPDGIRRTVLARPTDALPFLHDTAIAALSDGSLLAAWYTCTQGEIEGETSIRGCRIPGEQREMQPLQPHQEILVEGTDFHYVPVSLLPTEDGTYAFVTKMTDHDLPVGYCVLKETPYGWKRLADWQEPVLINTNPIPLGKDHWLAAGRLRPGGERYPVIPVVLLLSAADLSPRTPPEKRGHWKVIPIVTPETPAMACPETTVLLEAHPDGMYTITALSRASEGRPHIHTACFADPAELSDLGIWHCGGPADLPIAPVKMYSGTLPDGIQYLIYSQQTEADDRSRLRIALRREGNPYFTAVYSLGDGYDPVLGAGPFWHYPCAAVVGDNLYITCTANGPDNRRSAVLMTVPLSSLWV